MIKKIFLGILYVLFLLVAMKNDAQIGRRFPSEKKELTDPVTGAKLIFLTSSQDGDSKIYQTHNQWTADGQWVIFRSGKVKNEALAVNEKTGVIVQVTEGGYAGMLNVARKSMKLYIMRYAGERNINDSMRWKEKRPLQIIEVDLAKIFVDSEKIAWVITNLLSNAIHYSAENSHVIIGASQLEHKVEIYVRDFGKGIDPRYHQTIFERYFRVPGTKVQGSGLGLSISKDFVEAHGGTIRVDSELGKGCCFTVTFNV